jgi:hypothetical protein
MARHGSVKVRKLHVVGAMTFDFFDRSLSIVAETSPNSNRANFPLKSETKKFDGSLSGFRASAEKICAEMA